MHYRIKLLTIFLFFCAATLHAQVQPPTVSYHGINLITGKLQDDAVQSNRFQSDTYVVGDNQVGDVSVRLDKKDFRIGRVKIHRQWKVSTNSYEPVAYFFYGPNYTEVLNAQYNKTIYRYSAKERIESIEHFTSSSDLYRKERIFWDSTSSYIVSRVLEDAQGHAQLCCQFAYNKKGQLLKETLIGNLSGQCQAPLLIQTDGSVKQNGIEQFSTTYEYKNDLIVREISDSGAITLYEYDPKTKRCISKIQQDEHHIVSRHFYFYDPLGMLSRVIMDDGTSKKETDLTGVHARKILTIQPCLEEAAFGHPLVTESKYLDLQTHQEILLEKNVHTYSETGKLILKEAYDTNGEFIYSIQMHYDENGQLISSQDSRGKIIDASKETCQYREDDQHQRVAMIDQEGNETTFSYDEFGRLIKTIYPLVLNEDDQPVSYETRQEYDIHNHVICAYDANGQATYTSYNTRHKPIEIRYPDGSTEQFVYFLDGNLKETKAKNGHTTTYKRDSFGRVLRSDEFAENGLLLGSLLYTYEGTYLKSLTDEKTFTATFSYDGAGRQIGVRQQTKQGVKRREWSYDATGEKTAVKEWFGSGENDYVTKIQEKDSQQNPIATRLEDANGQTQTRLQAPQDNKEKIYSQSSPTSNVIGQSVRQDEVIDTNGLREITTYNALGQIESIVAIDPFGLKIRERQLRYDGNGNKVLERHSVLSQGNTIRTYTIRWIYDAANRIVGIQEGSHKYTGYQYNEKGQLLTVSKPDGTQLSYSYDAFGRPIHFMASDGSFEYRYQYDENHRLIQAEDLIHPYTLRRAYNDFNEIIEENFDSQFRIKNQYDLAGRRTQLTLPDNSPINYVYQGALLHAVQRHSDYTHTYQYDLDGKLDHSKLIHDIGCISYANDQQGHLSKIQSTWWSQTIPEGGFDEYHRLREMMIQDPLGDIQHNFSYTTDHQLASEQGYFNHRYESDSLYNCLQKDETPFIINEINQLTQTDQGHLQYDLNGNLIQKEDLHLHYDALNRLIRAEKKQEMAWDYRYDAFNRRLSQLTYRWENDQWILLKTDFFLYDGDKEIGLMNDSGKIEELRILGQGKGAEIGAAIAIELNGHVYAPIHDHQGSVRCLVDVETQQVAEFYRYSAYGSEEIYDENGQRLEHSALGNPWRYSSKRTHQPTGLIFFGRRDYDPTLMRWLAPDPLFFYDSPNLYAYVRQDPLTLCDPYGLFSVSSVFNYCVDKFFNYCYSLQTESDNMFMDIAAELNLPAETISAFERIGKNLLFGDVTLMLLGFKCDDVRLGVYGEGELSDKVRITFINGMFTTGNTIFDNLELLSASHGGTNIHYIFRPTEGWVRDIYQGIFIKVGFYFGFRSAYTYHLANTWKKMIEEMGGVNGGGTIIHYGHSLGGTETDRARNLLTPAEQKMIRVITIGSATLVRNEGFASVVNYISPRDGVSSFLLEPLGHLRNYFDSNSNVIFRGKFLVWDSSTFPCDHLLTGKTYQPIVIQLGEQFLIEFTPH